MRMRRTASLLLALALTTGLAACGDDDEGGDALEDVGGSGSGEETTEETADGDVDGEDSDIAEGFVGEGCVEFAEAFSQASAAAFGGTGGGGGDIGELASFFDDAAEDAPDEVADALRVFGEAYGEFARTLDEAGIDLSDPEAFQDPEAIAVLTEAGESLSSPEVTEAQQTIDDFVANNCES